MSEGPITYRRRELYEEIWAEPLRTVARRYGISDVALGKICRQLAVPRPGVGYWARLAAGQQPRRVPLPPAADGVPEEITRYRRTMPPWVNARPPKFSDSDGRTELIEVAASLEDAHALVATSIRALRHTKPDRDGVLRKQSRRCLDVVVSPAQLDRSMLILDALFRNLEKLGIQCEVTEPQRYDKRGRRVVPDSVPLNTTRVCIDGEWFEVRLSEKYAVSEGPPPTAPKGLRGEALDSWRRWNRPTQLRTPNCVLKLSLIHSYRRATWTDGKRKPLDQRLAVVVAGFQSFAMEIKAEREEIDRRHREFDEDMRRRREAQRRAEEERVRAERLAGQVANWRRAQGIRDYVAAIRSLRDSDAPTNDPRFTEDALGWVLSLADRIDPLSSLRRRAEEADDDLGEEDSFF